MHLDIPKSGVEMSHTTAPSDHDLRLKLSTKKPARNLLVYTSIIDSNPGFI